MDHYIDIKLNPDAEMRENLLMNKVYTKLHKRLFDLQSTSIGASFPEFQLNLGRLLRIHGRKENISKLQEEDWIGGLVGYCEVTDIEKIPLQVNGYRTVSRIQPTMSFAKLRRLKRRGSIQSEEEKNYKAEMFRKGIDNPYLELESASNELLHRRYISFGDLKQKAVSGKFDSFGLSKTATIPWF